MDKIAPISFSETIDLDKIDGNSLKEKMKNITDEQLKEASDSRIIHQMNFRHQQRLDKENSWLAKKELDAQRRSAESRKQIENSHTTANLNRYGMMI